MFFFDKHSLYIIAKQVIAILKNKIQITMSTFLTVQDANKDAAFSEYSIID
jgi:hypothetical protein